MINTLHPGVYVEELRTLPPSVVGVATAIPAFLGYTEKGYPETGTANKPTRISSLVEYEQRFGTVPSVSVTCTTVQDNYRQNEGMETSASTPVIQDVALATSPKFLLYYSLKLYFDNGGGPCYVVSVGKYDEHTTANNTVQQFTDALDALQQEDEPTLVLAPDAAVALTAADSCIVSKALLTHCGKLKNRFAILDVPGPGIQATTDIEDFRTGIGNENLSYGAAYTPWLTTTLGLVYDESNVTVTFTPAVPGLDDATTLKSLASRNTVFYNRIKTALAASPIVLPPSAAIAGVYARIDRERGVWKAPANVGLVSVSSLTRKFTDDEQDGLNIVADSGKSINAIRTFTGRGTLVWGARTLAGNDNEWRYVNVRRLFITIEESIRKASVFAVFEPNDATTWLKVQGMIESYLYGLWQQGALAGAKPEHAYFVNVGLGKTMTPQNILEGKLIVEVGVAAVRPAEFIILKFSHKMQES